MYKHFGYIGKNLYVNIFLSPDFAKCLSYVIRIPIKWLTERFYTIPYTDTDDKNSPNVFNCFNVFRIRNADTDADPEKWNRGLTHFIWRIAAIKLDHEKKKCSLTA